MSTAPHEGDRIAMSQRERDRLRVLLLVLEGQRTQVEAARLLRLTPRHVRQLLLRLQYESDAVPFSDRLPLASRVPWEA